MTKNEIFFSKLQKTGKKNEGPKGLVEGDEFSERKMAFWIVLCLTLPVIRRFLGFVSFAVEGSMNQSGE